MFSLRIQWKPALPVVVGIVMVAGCDSAPPEGAAREVGRDASLVDELLSVTSVVGGAPEWAPDGSHLLYPGGGTVWSVDPASGARVDLGVGLGGAGHFQASHLPKYSPGGEWLSFISTRSGDQELWLWSPEDGQEVQLTNLGGRINSYSWSPDGEWIAFAGDRLGTYDIWRVRVPTGETYRVTTDGRYEVFPSWSPDGEHLLYVRLDERWVEHDVFEITADGGSPRHVLHDEEFFDYRSGGTFGYPLVSPDGETVMFRSHRSGWINYWVVPRTGGSPGQVAPEESDQSDAQWSPDGRHVAFTSNENGTHSLRVVDVREWSVRTLVDPEVGQVSAPRWSPDGSRISYTYGTPTRPADLFVVDVATGESTQLTSSFEDEHLERTLVTPEKIAYQSTDGYTIPSYLYKPPHMEPGDTYPGVLLIHGGPTSQFHDNVNHIAQFFAQQGYVFLLPNIRGSSGYGKEFEEGNMGCWGRCDLEDVVAGVDYLRSQAYVDGDNIGITGSSYGGIMSMAAPTFAPGVFQAAISISGYGDYLHFMDEQEIRHIKLLEYELGRVEENEELYRHLSPLFFVEDITTPMFIIHGEGFFPESDAGRLFAQELERHYKPFRYKTYPNENYYVRSRENRAQMMLDMLEFFDHHLREHGIESFSPGPTHPVVADR